MYKWFKTSRGAVPVNQVEGYWSMHKLFYVWCSRAVFELESVSAVFNSEKEVFYKILAISRILSMTEVESHAILFVDTYEEAILPDVCYCYGSWSVPDFDLLKKKAEKGKNWAPLSEVIDSPFVEIRFFDSKVIGTDSLINRTKDVIRNGVSVNLDSSPGDDNLARYIEFYYDCVSIKCSEWYLNEELRTIIDEWFKFCAGLQTLDSYTPSEPIRVAYTGSMDSFI